MLERIVALLNADLIPRVPRTGSLGASGDLAPSAHAFLPLIGEGQLVDGDGHEISGAHGALADRRRALRLRPKEGLALINGTHFMAAIGALAVTRFSALLETADLVAALTLAALNGNLAPFEPRVQQLRPLPGQAISAANVMAVARDARPGATCKPPRLQDAYSLRCIPQVHGAAREANTFLRHLVSVDLDAVTDNPIVFEDPLDVVSAGNFHGQSLALGFDTARLAPGRSRSDLRTSDLPHAVAIPQRGAAGLSQQRRTDPSSGYMITQYTAAALVAELRALAHPVSVDSIATSDNQEDHVSFGMTAAMMTLEALDRLTAVYAIELLCAAQALDHSEDLGSDRVATIHRLIRRTDPPSRRGPSSGGGY